LCQTRGFSIVRRSQKQVCSENTDVFLGDTMGELPLFFSASDVAFVGGSFVPVGGHNLLEPAALGLPVLTGPVVFNFLAITDMLVSASGATIVSNEEKLCEALTILLSDKSLRQAQGARAKNVVEKNRGALDNLLALTDTMLAL